MYTIQGWGSEEAVGLVEGIRDLGFEAYIVGGAVRDIVMNVTPHDFDIATNCPMDVLEENFETYDIGQSKDFGIKLVRFEGVSFEVAQYRTDEEYKDGRHPDKVKFVSNIKDDVLRRDFTINALVMDTNGTVIDYVGGVEDIENKLIRAVGNPYRRFHEDRLRMMRAARFAARTKFKIEKETARAIKRLSKLIHTVTKERLRMEILKAANRSGEEFARFIEEMDGLKLLSKVMPEVSNMKYYRHNLQHHPEGPTVFDHIMECLKITGEVGYKSMMAILLHDIGKPVTFAEIDGRPRYYYHADKGAKLVADFCNRLKFSEYNKHHLVFATLNHMKFHDILKMRPSKIARLANSPFWETLVDVARADEFSRGEKFKYRGEFEKELARAIEIKEQWESRVINQSIKIVDGNKVMELTGLEPSREVGLIKKAVEDKIIDEGLDPDDQKLIDKLIMEEYNE
jgi:poly(A) polymerase